MLIAHALRARILCLFPDCSALATVKNIFSYFSQTRFFVEYGVIIQTLQNAVNKPSTYERPKMTYSAQTVANFEARLTLLKGHRLAATSADLHAILTRESSPFYFSLAVSAQIDAWGIETDKVFAVDRNPKVIKRFIQFAYAVSAKNFAKIDITSAVIIYALHLAKGKPLTADALHYFATGALAEGKVSPETRGVSLRALRKVLGRVGLSTVPTQCSRTVGKNGFLQLVGATVGEPGKTNQVVTLNSDHAMIQSFFSTMNNATDSQLEQLPTSKGASE